MEATNPVDIVVGAALVAIASFIAVKVVGTIVRWFMHALRHTLAETVSDVVAPDLARLGNRLGSAVDELRVANTNEHRADQARLAAVEDRLDAVEDRLVALDGRIPHRPSDARTRVTDQEEPE
jgi:hypothetical protein